MLKTEKIKMMRLYPPNQKRLKIVNGLRFNIKKRSMRNNSEVIEKLDNDGRLQDDE